MRSSTSKGKAIRRKAKQGFRGYPLATIAFYGPTDHHATKVAVGIIADDTDEVVDLRRWFTDSTDVRVDPEVEREVFAYLKEQAVKSVALADRIIGCPHEEGKDYPEGQQCQECTWWLGRDRFTGKYLH